MSAAPILVFVEDPGASNYVAGLAEALAGHGHTCHLVATAHGAEQLRSLDTPFEPLKRETGAAELLEPPPSLVVAGTSDNPDTLGLELIDLARRRGLTSVGLVDSSGIPEHRFRGRGPSALRFAPDHILVPDRVTHQRFVELGHAGERVHVCGNPHFDHVCTVARGLDQRGLGEVRRAVVPGAPDDLPVVVFSAEVSDGPEPFRYYRDADYTLTGRGGSDRRTDIVLEEVLDALAGIEPRPYVVLRPHPKNLDDEFDAYAAEVGEISRAGSSTEAVFAADVVVGMTSMMLLEAALMGRPALSVLPRRREAEWLTSIAMGLTPAVFTRRELCRKLRTAIADSASWGATPAEEVIEFDALERMADVLAGLVKDGPDGTAE